MGYETALLHKRAEDAESILPVERYKDKGAAQKGHAKWVEWAADPKNTQVKELGYLSCVAAKMVELERAAK